MSDFWKYKGAGYWYNCKLCGTQVFGCASTMARRISNVCSRCPEPNDKKRRDHRIENVFLLNGVKHCKCNGCLNSHYYSYSIVDGEIKCYCKWCDPGL